MLNGTISNPTVDLATLDKQWVDAAKRRKDVVNLARSLPSEMYQQLRLGYLHYSADTGLVNTPNTVGGKEVRHLPPVTKRVVINA